MRFGPFWHKRVKKKKKKEKVSSAKKRKKEAAVSLRDSGSEVTETEAQTNGCGRVNMW